MAEPQMKRADAEDICREPWPSEAEAKEAATHLQRGGWKVEWRAPGAEWGKGSGVYILASVYHPDDYSSPGDVTWRSSEGTG